MAAPRLTPEQTETLRRRRENLPAFVAECGPVLADLVERIGWPDPDTIQHNPDRFLAVLDRWLRDVTVEPEDRVWLAARVTYYVGALLIQRCGGCWLVEEDPASPYFAHYVVGRLDRGASGLIGTSPFLIADRFLSEPPGRSLVALMQEVEHDLRPP